MAVDRDTRSGDRSDVDEAGRELLEREPAGLSAEPGPDAVRKPSAALSSEVVIRLDPDIERQGCLLYTSPSPRDVEESRMPSSA